MIGRAVLLGDFLFHAQQVLADEVKDLFGGQQGDDVPPAKLQGPIPVSTNRSRRKNRRKFAAVEAANSSAAKFLTLARVRATSAT